VPSAYDAANQQLLLGEASPTFGATGNLLTQVDSSGTIIYTWDARNRLVAISGPSLSASFAYDGLGRRAVRTVDSTTTSFRYDGLDVAQETSGEDAVAYLRSLNIDEALVRTDAEATVHYLADALGSTVALTDLTGTSATTYNYEPFGRTEASGTPSANASRFTGREDDGTGLYYYRARYYGRSGSRFMSEDPIGFRGGDINLYSYGANGPLNATDPLGLWSQQEKQQIVANWATYGMAAGSLLGLLGGGGAGLSTGPAAVIATPAGALKGAAVGGAMGATIGAGIGAGIVTMADIIERAATTTGSGKAIEALRKPDCNRFMECELVVTQPLNTGMVACTYLCPDMTYVRQVEFGFCPKSILQKVN